MSAAIQRGSKEGVGALTPTQRTVFLISEAEVTCDKDGIDNLVQQYGRDKMSLFAEAFLSVGATSIARAFAELAKSAAPNDALLSQLNAMITSREGYSYESIAAHVSGI